MRQNLRLSNTNKLGAETAGLSGNVEAREATRLERAEEVERVFDVYVRIADKVLHLIIIGTHVFFTVVQIASTHPR